MSFLCAQLAKVSVLVAQALSDMGGASVDPTDEDFQKAVHDLIRAAQTAYQAESSRSHLASLGIGHTFLTDAQCKTLEGLRGEEIVAQAPLSVGELIARLKAEVEKASRETD